MSDPSPPTSLQQLNMDLARALGIDNPGQVTELQLIVKPCQLPTVKASFCVRSADGLASLMREYVIQPLPMGAASQADEPQEARDAA